MAKHLHPAIQHGAVTFPGHPTMPIVNGVVELPDAIGQALGWPLAAVVDERPDDADEGVSLGGMTAAPDAEPLSMPRQAGRAVDGPKVKRGKQR